MEVLEQAIKNDPSLPEKWRVQGEKQFQHYQQTKTQSSRSQQTEADIVIPIVFHIVDAAAVQAGITDRDIYEQVESLNKDYAGKKMELYSKVIAPEIIARVGKIPIRFILAKRTPAGLLTSGIERRTSASPGRVEIKSSATGGLDAWDTDKYLNVWCGTFSGADAGLLGIATFPFVTTEGPQGVVIGSSTLLFTSANSRPYEPLYAEGATLSHEIGHYLYLWHTFGDQDACNNVDFRLQAGWALPTGAGPEGDDTPEEGAAPNGTTITFGNPSMNYNDGCTAGSFGIMYGSFMNYYDDRSLFMFSDGMRKRVLGCIDAYRPGLKTSNGAIPPSPVTDAYLVNVDARGFPDRRSFIANNTPINAYVRNSGTTTLTSVIINMSVDGGAAIATPFALNLASGRDTSLSLGAVSAGAGNHRLTVYTTAPNGASDNFTNNDTLLSFINIATTSFSITASVPLIEDFSSASFPSVNWRIWNPNPATSTWTRSSISGFSNSGSAFFDNYNMQENGTFDELISVPLDFGMSDSALLSFGVAHAVVDDADVSAWDGLEVYISGDGGRNYSLAYKKSGNQLKTLTTTQLNSFTALPTQPERWRLETINLSPYLSPGQKMLVKFRNVNAFGNNTFLDDIKITGMSKPLIDIEAVSVQNLPGFGCNTSASPSLVVRNNGIGTINTYKVNVKLDNGSLTTITSSTPLTGGQLATIPLGTISLAQGNHIVTVYASEPNGSVDLIPGNDTLRIPVVVFPNVSTPFTENFESGTFPPIGWAVNNPDGLITWSTTTLTSRKVKFTDSTSAFVRNFTYAGTNKVDELYSPVINFSNVDSVFLQFDIAASNNSKPGTSSTPTDTLEVLISKNCGATFQSVYKKWGAALQTISSPYDPNPKEFISLSNNWRRDSVNLLPYIGTTSSFQVIFRNTHNAPGNNIFLDNINVTTRILPPSLKQQGYLILPTVFNTQFGIWHYLKPAALSLVNVYNSIG
ncbi:MAG: M43 family zinc metalloprotease, partial [Bacteroidota bacterium]|nr:M43 family zinc metalloprotease [Bacteroidota bacterium]